MKKTFNIILVGIIMLLASACSSQKLNAVRLPLGYIPNVQFAPLYVAIEKGYFAEEDILVELDYNMETDSVALVGSGELQFAIVSGEQVLLGRAQQLPVVYVAAWYEDYPVGIAALKEQNLRSPQDLKGKTIGLPGLYGASYIGLEALLHAGGLSDADVTLQSIGYTQVESLANQVVDVVDIYTTNEPIQLQARGYEVDVLPVSDYLSLVANGLITNEKTLEQDPDLVRGMVRALTRGITYTAEHADEAFQICEKYVDNLASLTHEEQDVQRQVLAASIKIWQVEQPGYSDPQAWQNMQDLLLRMELLSDPLELTVAYSNAYLPE